VVRGVVDEKDVASGKVKVIAPTGFAIRIRLGFGYRCPKRRNDNA
jgi:hypothetical protein